MSDAGIELEYRGHNAIVILNRPEKRNAFDRNMWEALEQVVARLRTKLPRAVIVTGAGDRAFSAGFDVSPENPQVPELGQAIQAGDRGHLERFIRYIRETAYSLVSLPVAVIAAINGIAYGGGAELAAQCDLRLMDADATVNFSEVRLGLMPDQGGGVALTRLLGRSRAADLILTARNLSADEAYRLGFADRVTAPGMCLDESIALAESISRNGPRAVRAALEVIRRSRDLPVGDAMELETLVAADLIASGECIHGITAFISKKEPQFPDPE
jgi:enoyl-CoA hydratase